MSNKTQPCDSDTYRRCSQSWTFLLHPKLQHSVLLTLIAHDEKERTWTATPSIRRGHVPFWQNWLRQGRQGRDIWDKWACTGIRKCMHMYRESNGLDHESLPSQNINQQWSRRITTGYRLTDGDLGASLPVTNLPGSDLGASLAVA